MKNDQEIRYITDAISILLYNGLSKYNFWGSSIYKTKIKKGYSKLASSTEYHECKYIVEDLADILRRMENKLHVSLSKEEIEEECKLYRIDKNSRPYKIISRSSSVAEALIILLKEYRDIRQREIINSEHKNEKQTDRVNERNKETEPDKKTVEKKDKKFKLFRNNLDIQIKNFKKDDSLANNTLNYKKIIKRINRGEILQEFNNFPSPYDKILNNYVLINLNMKLDQITLNIKKLVVEMYHLYIKQCCKETSGYEAELLYLCNKLNIEKLVRDFDNKYPQYKTINEINEEMHGSIDSSISYKVRNWPYQDHSYIFLYTKLMSMNEIIQLYEDYIIKFQEMGYELKNLKCFQSDFAYAILYNSSYRKTTKCLTMEEQEIERIIICINYLKELPIGFKTKEDVVNYIQKNIKNLYTIKKIIKCINFDNISSEENKMKKI